MTPYGWFILVFKLVYALVLLGTPFLCYYMYAYEHADSFDIQKRVASIFVGLTVPVSIFGVVQHLLYYHQPHLQKYVVRILWMVPLYSVESYLSLIADSYSLYIRACRELYEAYVLYCFLYFLIYYLGDEEELSRKLSRKDPKYGKHYIPFNWCIKPWKMGREFLRNCKIGVLQYVVLKVLTTIATMILEGYDVYKETEGLKMRYGYLWITVINNFTQTWALYVLVLFYHATMEELRPINPIFKFICVKMVVFFSFWQALGISILEANGFITSPLPRFTDVQYSLLLQDFLICIEMFFGAVSHQYAFDYKEFNLGTNSTEIIKSFLDSANPKDTISELTNNMNVKSRHTSVDHRNDEEQKLAFERGQLFDKYIDSDVFDRKSSRNLTKEDITRGSKL